MSPNTRSDDEIAALRANLASARIDPAVVDALVDAWRPVGGSFLDHLVRLGALDDTSARTIRAVLRGYLRTPLGPLFAGLRVPEGLRPAPPPGPPPPAPPSATPDLDPVPEWNSLAGPAPLPAPTRAAPTAAHGRASRRIEPAALVGAPPIGARIDVYTLREVLAASAGAAVYRARDERQQRPVVLKLLRRDRPTRERERILTEARILARLAHPSIVGLLGAGLHDGLPYVVLEDIFAIGLDEHLAAAGPLASEAIARIALHVARGLQAAHEVGVVHHDLKPANLLVHGEGGRVKITDFGLASECDSLRADGLGTLRGTAAYMAPEHVIGRAPADHRADMYGLGVTLYEAATGAPPFVRPTLLETMRAHVHDPPPPLAERAPGLAPALVDVIARLLRKRPDERFSTWPEVASAVEVALRGLASPISDAVRRAVRGDDGVALPSLFGRT